MNDTFKLEHLKKSVINIRNELGNRAIIKIVINGKAVQLMLKDNKVSSDIVTILLKNKADIGLCHNAIKNNNIKKSLLIAGVRVLPEDGNVTIINLQKEGYVYIKI